MLCFVHSFKPRGRHFTNFHYYYQRLTVLYCWDTTVRRGHQQHTAGHSAQPRPHRSVACSLVPPAATHWSVGRTSPRWILRLHCTSLQLQQAQALLHLLLIICLPESETLVVSSRPNHPSQSQLLSHFFLFSHWSVGCTFACWISHLHCTSPSYKHRHFLLIICSPETLVVPPPPPPPPPPCPNSFPIFFSLGSCFIFCLVVLPWYNHHGWLH